MFSVRLETKFYIKFRISVLKRNFGIPPPPNGAKPLVGQGLIIIEASRSHSDTPHSVGLLWTSDQPDAQTST
jgi:hypothetical protein